MTLADTLYSYESARNKKERSPSIGHRGDSGQICIRETTVLRKEAVLVQPYNQITRVLLKASNQCAV